MSDIYKFTTTYTGLNFTAVNGYFSDNANFFNANLYGPIATGTITNFTNLTTATNGVETVNTGSSFSVQWVGYLLANATGTWTFGLNSDDASYMWIGSNAASGYTTGNANINNYGQHTVGTAPGVTCTISLTSGTYYPIRIQYGQNGSGCDCQFCYKPPGGSSYIYDFSGIAFTTTTAYPLYGSPVSMSQGATAGRQLVMPANTWYRTLRTLSFYSIGNATSNSWGSYNANINKWYDFSTVLSLYPIGAWVCLAYHGQMFALQIQSPDNYQIEGALIEQTASATLSAWSPGTIASVILPTWTGGSPNNPGYYVEVSPTASQPIIMFDASSYNCYSGYGSPGNSVNTAWVNTGTWGTTYNATP